MKVNEEEKTELESDNFGCIIFGKLVIIFSTSRRTDSGVTGTHLTSTVTLTLTQA